MPNTLALTWIIISYTFVKASSPYQSDCITVAIDAFAGLNDSISHTCFFGNFFRCLFL